MKIKLPYQNWTPDTAPFYAAGENTAQNCLPYLAAPNYTQVNSIALSAIGQPNAGTYVANATEFNNGPYMTNTSNLTGIANGKTGTLSVWIRIDALPQNGELMWIWNATNPYFTVTIFSSTGNVQINGLTSASATTLAMGSSAGYSPSTKWLNILASWNLATGATNLYINNVSDNNTTLALNNNINYAPSSGQIRIGSDSTAVANFDGAISEFWFDTSFMDLSVLSNRQKFINAGAPVSLGSTGQTPTGSSPLLYLKSAAGQFNVNSGTGGNFVTTGSLSIASTNPSGATPSQFLGAASFIDSNDSPHTYAGTSSQLVEITATTANNVSKSGGYTAQGSWEFEGFTAAGTNNVYATDYNDNVQVMAVGGTAFADLAGSPPKAKHIGQIGQFILLGNTNGGTIGTVLQGAVPNRVQWCAIGNPASWPDPLTNAGIAAQAGFQDMNLAYGAVQKIVRGQLYGLVFQENAISNFYYVGGNTVFQINTYEKQRGCYCPNGVVQVGAMAYFIHSSGFFVTDGASVEPIGHDQVDNTWLADVNTQYLSNVRGSHDVANKCIWWTYPSLTSTLQGGFVVCDKVIVYNYVDKRWAMGMVGQSIDILFSSYTLGYTMEQLDSVNSNLDLITPSLDSPYWNGGVPVIGVFGIQQIGSSGSYASYVGSLSGTPLTATIDTKEMQLNEGGLAMVNAVNPVVMGATLSNISVAPITRNTLSASPAVGTLVAPETRTGKCSMRSNARYHRFRVQIAGGFQNSMGVEHEFTPAGEA